MHGSRKNFLCLTTLVALLVTAPPAYSEELHWPKVLDNGESSVTIFQPQAESYESKLFRSRAAFSLRTAESSAPVFGVFWSEMILETDRKARTVAIKSIRISDIKLPEGFDLVKTETLRTEIEQQIAGLDLWFPLDQLVASLDQIPSAKNSLLLNDAPEIIISNVPAILVLIDGEPQYRKFDKTYRQVSNTNAFIAQDLESDRFFLKGGNRWYSSDALVDSEWQIDSQTSKALIEFELASSSAKPAEDITPAKDAQPPRIIVRKAPAELVITDGEPSFSPIDNTSLLYVLNTDSDVFMEIETQTYYTLISGRWFLAKKLDGAWSYLAADRLPADFSKINEDSAKGAVLANVAGTHQAIDAVHDAQIPQTAEIDRSKATASAEYNGKPKFTEIEGLDLKYSVNTSNSIFKSSDTYYMCEDGVWYRSSSAQGPWQVSPERPPEIESIPPSNPHYNVKYVYIYDVTPTTIYTGYTSGYVGGYVYGPTIVYGTGYRYSSWYNGFYYPRPYTYGYSVRYNPWNGWSLGFNYDYGSPYGWFYRGYWGPRHYRPPHHRHHHHHSDGWGHGGSGYNPGHGGSSNRPGSTQSIYGNSKGVKPFKRPQSLTRTKPATRPALKPNTRPAIASRPTSLTRPAVKPEPSMKPVPKPTSRPAPKPSTRPNIGLNNNYYKRPAPTPVRTKPKTNVQHNNIYADQKGNVHRRTSNGWQQYSNKGWSNNRRPPAQVNRSHMNRSRGSQNTQKFNQHQTMTRRTNGARASMRR